MACDPSRVTDPRALGAECDRCPLGPHARFRQDPDREDARWAPVVGEGDSEIVIVGPTPSREDTAKGRPMVGPFGVEVMRALKQWPGASRSLVAWETVIACAPPGFDWRRFDLRLKAHNRKRERKGLEPLPSPVECCAPRLRRRLADASAVIPMGSLAYKAVVGSTAKINDIRGTIALHDIPVLDRAGAKTYRRVKVAPTISSFLHRRRWLAIMRLDMLRALSWFHGQLSWTEPKITITQDPAVIRDFRRRKAGGRLVYDIETDGVYPRATKVRCIGWADEHEALVVPIHDIDGTCLWSDKRYKQVTRYICEWLASDEVELWGHNAEYFDRLVIEFWSESVLGERITPALDHDTIAAASVIMPEHPKSLAFAATVHSAEGTPAWKADHTAVTARDMEELGTYNGMDCVINMRIGKPMLDLVRERGQDKPYRVLRAMQGICAQYHRAGMPVDLDEQQRLYRQCIEREKAERQEARKALEATGTPVEGYGRPKRKGDPCYFNPNSADHLREVLFVKWGLLPPATLSAKDCYTDGGEFSVAKKVLIALQYDAQTSDEQRAFLRRLLVYKRWAKRRSTAAGFGVRHWENALYAGRVGASRIVEPGRMRTKKRTDGSTFQVPKYTGHTDARTGRIHASWNAHGTNVSRVSCSGPNLVNVDKFFRPVFRAPPGYKFVGADWSALHFRLMAAFWKIPRLVEACTPSPGYPDGKDAHALLAGMIFGDKFWKAEGHPDPSRLGAIGDYTGEAKRLRTPIKAFGYSMGYDASPQTIYRVMASAMNEDGTRAHPGITPEIVEAFHDKTMTAEPEWRRNWQRTRDFWREHGYIAEPINGRKCWFEDGYVLDGIFTDSEDDDVIAGNVGNQIPNFEILGAEGSFASNVTIEFNEAVPPDYAGPGTGNIHQNYDSLLALVPEHDAERVAGIMTEIMSQTINGIKMVADAAVGDTWADVS